MGEPVGTIIPLGILVAGLAAGCGSDVITDGSGASGADGGAGGQGGIVEMPPPPEVLSLPNCPSLLGVPRGDGWVGSFTVDDEFTLTPTACGCCGGAKELSVPAVYLDEDEVTNECFAHCVDANVCAEPPPAGSINAWDNEAISDHPVAATVETAAAFCAWRGGRLPTIAELARASHADEAGVTTTELLALARACWEDRHSSTGESSACELLLSRGTFELYQAPIRSEEVDIGPFGHTDIFGSRCEITASSWQLTETEWETFCSLESGTEDPDVFGADLSSRARFCPAASLNNAVPWAPGGALVDATVFNSEGPSPDAGIRCAYDPIGN